MARKTAAPKPPPAVVPPLPPVLAKAPAPARPKPKAPSGPRAVEAAPPALSLHQAGPLAVLRIHDLSYSPIVSVIAQALPPEVAQLMLVTPTDTKMFNLVAQEAHEATNRIGAGSSQRPNGAVLPVADGAGATEAEANADFSDDPQAQAILDSYEAEGQAQAIDTVAAEAEAASAETPAARRKALNELRKASGEAGQDATCGRCRGAGSVAIAMPDGGASTSACPVCQGRGSIRRYGAGRR